MMHIIFYLDRAPIRFTNFTSRSLFTQLSNSSRENISYFASQEESQRRINALAEQTARFVVLEMLLGPILSPPPMFRNLIGSFDDFIESTARASFHYGHHFQYNIPMRERPVVGTSAAGTAAKITHVPQPNPVLLNNAKAAIAKLEAKGQPLPDELLDPISCDTLDDPILINHRVYNRSTIEGIAKDNNGKFRDPVTREMVELSTAQSAAEMILGKAIPQHCKLVTEAEKPTMLNDRNAYEQKAPYLMRALFEAWENLFHEFQSNSQSNNQRSHASR